MKLFVALTVDAARSKNARFKLFIFAIGLGFFVIPFFAILLAFDLEKPTYFMYSGLIIGCFAAFYFFINICDLNFLSGSEMIIFFVISYFIFIALYSSLDRNSLGSLLHYTPLLNSFFYIVFYNFKNLSRKEQDNG